MFKVSDYAAECKTKNIVEEFTVLNTITSQETHRKRLYEKDTLAAFNRNSDILPCKPSKYIHTISAVEDTMVKLNKINRDSDSYINANYIDVITNF